MIVTSPTGTQTPESIIRDGLANMADWRTIVTDLVAWLVTNDRCFSSGEVAAYLRTYAGGTLAFSVGGVGNYLRDQYDGGHFPSYDDGQGNMTYPVQVPRTTNGVARTLDGRNVVSKTSVGQTVFIYAKDGTEGFAHDFEVFIPDYDDADATRAVTFTGTLPPPVVVVTTPSPIPGSAPVVTSPATPATMVQITGALAKDDTVASVSTNYRMYVPRAAIEALVKVTGRPITGGPQGDPVYVKLSGDQVVISLDSDPTAYACALWGSGDGRGRAVFDAAKLGVPTAFTPGKKYKIQVTATNLVVDLSNPL